MVNEINKPVLAELAEDIGANEQNNKDQSPSTFVDKFVIRLPEGLRSQIKDLSEHNHRSMNSEIIMVLEKHVQQNRLVDENGNKIILSENAQAEQEVHERLEDLKEALLHLLS